MISSLGEKDLGAYVASQLSNIFPDTVNLNDSIRTVLPEVRRRLEHCFEAISSKYYGEQESNFNHMNSNHYAMFLYFLSNEAFRRGLLCLAEKAFYLNKVLNGLDVFYEVELPGIFQFIHPVGTVLGKAEYSDNLVVYQNVTVGSDLVGIYPSIGSGCILYSKSSVIGKCVIGDNVTFAAGAFIRNNHIESNSIVLGMYPNHTAKFNTQNNQRDFFGIS